MQDGFHQHDNQVLLGQRPKAVIGHPRLGRGGSEARVMWLIEALKRDFEVTVATTGGWDRNALNSYYGTQINENEVTVRIAPVPWLVRRVSAAALRGACFQRFARQIAGEYDVRISAYNPTDWGLPAIHFIADFSWHPKLRERLDPPTPGLIYRDTAMRRAYLKVAAAYGKPSDRDILRDDQVVANSQWSAKLVKEFCAVDCTAIVYPSVWTEFPEVQWENKENSFAMIGRIAPEKQVERAIEVLEAVRERGHSVRLHLCGQIEKDAYGRGIARLCAERSSWIVTEGQVSGRNKAQILAKCRFGIQTRGAEPFGISVAEMVKAGAIVFAPNDGGQREVLDCPDLLFRNVRDAAEKIDKVLRSKQKQADLRLHLAKRSEMFSASKFMNEAHSIVKARLNRVKVAVSSQSRRKVVIGHPRLGLGGSESAVMWLIEALKRDFEVTVLTTGGWNRSALNAYYGTQVAEHEVKVRTAPVPSLIRGMSAAALRGACFQRFARRIAAEYDIRISAYNPTDWGLPAIHFIADFSWHQDLRERLDPPSPGFIYRDSIVRKAYLAIASAYGKPSGRDILHDDLLIANSQWSAGLLKRTCGVDCAAVVYPPVWTNFPDVPWEHKESAFVMIGRIAPEKRVERAIEILEGVRAHGYPIQFHLCGEIGNDIYGRQVATLCHDRRNWIIGEGRVSGMRKQAILTQCRYGIQTRGAEPFGISVGEMVRAGAIVFAPNDGGQAEILNHSDLLFSDVRSAIQAICNVLDSEEKQRTLRCHLAKNSQRFKSVEFVSESASLVASASELFQVQRGYSPQQLLKITTSAGK